MFPRHEDPAIAGDERIEPEALKLDLSQIFGGSDPEELARHERDRALGDATGKGSAAEDESETPAALDRLVDELDDLDL